MNVPKTIAILTSGGDAPGMNAAIRAATMIAKSRGVRMVGIEHGFRGLLEDRVVELYPETVRHRFRDGGTMLYSARCLEFHEKKARDRARKVLSRRGIDSVIVIGGNGSLTGALALSDPNESESAPQVIGIPASIDNDIGLTGMSIGVDTALNTIVEACDKISDTASAHDRTFIVEVMGRDCGYLAMTAGIASGADLVLYPEASKSDSEIVEAAVKAVVAAQDPLRGLRSVLILKAEGVPLATSVLKESLDARLQHELGERAAEMETRISVLGHVVRGGRPSAFDRLLASRLGHAAVDALLRGARRKMVSWMPPIELDDDIAKRSEVDPYCWVVDLEAALAETQSLSNGESALARWRAGALDELDDILLG